MTDPLPPTALPELLPCPFCGSPAELFSGRYRISGHGESSDSVGVKCAACPVEIAYWDYSGYKKDEREIKAIHAWNTRAERAAGVEKLGPADEHVEYTGRAAGVSESQDTPLDPLAHPFTRRYVTKCEAERDEARAKLAACERERDEDKMVIGGLVIRKGCDDITWNQAKALGELQSKIDAANSEAATVIGALTKELAAARYETGKAEALLGVVKAMSTHEHAITLTDRCAYLEKDRDKMIARLHRAEAANARLMEAAVDFVDLEYYQESYDSDRQKLKQALSDAAKDGA